MRARTANLLGFAICSGLLGFAYFAQYSLHLEPCPLCIFQRVGVFVMGLVFLAAAIHDGKGAARGVYCVLLALAAAATIGIAVRQLYIQSQPPGTVAACGASLDFMLKILPLKEVLLKVLEGSGECAKVTWRFLGLAMPGWVLISAAALAAGGLLANGRRPPGLRA